MQLHISAELHSKEQGTQWSSDKGNNKEKRFAATALQWTIKNSKTPLFGDNDTKGTSHLHFQNFLYLMNDCKTTTH